MNPADYGWTALTMHRATGRDLAAMRRHHNSRRGEDVA